MDPVRLLLVEDDARSASLLAAFLERRGIRVTVAADLERARLELRHRPPDVVVLDLMLAGGSGLDLLRAVRERGDLPVLVVSALGEESDRVLGLELGADDYLVKPVSARELLARIHTVLRRAGAPRVARTVVGGLVLEPERLRATLNGVELELTSYEFELLRALASAPGRVLTREQLLEQAKGDPDEVNDRSIDVQISRLRRKLGDDARRPRWLKTLRGRGYMLAANPSP
ncbi:MAG: response regulator transcription factor [Myxococcota bacterium]